MLDTNMRTQMSDFELGDFSYWRLCDELSVIQAALLIVGEEPAGIQEWVLSNTAQDRPAGFDAAFAALKNAIRAKTLKACVRRDSWEQGFNEEPRDGQLVGRDERGVSVIYEAHPNWGETTVSVTDLKEWFDRRGERPRFFFRDAGNAGDTPDYLDPKGSRYPAKLAAAVRAWEAVTDPAGRHPKQALVKWLREHAAEFSLTDAAGKPNETGIDEVAKVANWQPGGGAPKTPGIT